MITAMDFGCSRIRSAFRNRLQPGRLSVCVERSEYAVISDTPHHRHVLTEQQIPYAECKEALVVVGNRTDDVRWLTRLPMTPLLTDGMVPTDDPPARQMLHVLTSGMLPPSDDTHNLCAVVTPGIADNPILNGRNRDFLSRLIRMQGYEPTFVSAAAAAMLAAGGETHFTGTSVVIGAESTEICISRYGVSLASMVLPVGCNWIDSELSRQFRMFAWDDAGDAYLDLEAVRRWKHENQLDIHAAVGERERMLSRLFTVLLDQVTRSLDGLLAMPAVRRALGQQRLTLVLSGGGAMTSGLTGLVTDRLVEHDVADRFAAIRLAPSPDLAVVRGALIFAELEAHARSSAAAA